MKFDLSHFSLHDAFWSWTGAFVGIALVAYLEQVFCLGTDRLLIIGSFGASAVLIYGVPNSPLAQPRNLIGGHIISAIIGVFCFQALGANLWLAASVAVATAIVAMQLTKTAHPPGGATALIAVIGGERVCDLGYYYVLMPVATGAFILLFVAVIVNNLSKKRTYPLSWF